MYRVVSFIDFFPFHGGCIMKYIAENYLNIATDSNATKRTI